MRIATCAYANAVASDFQTSAVMLPSCVCLRRLFTERSSKAALTMMFTGASEAKLVHEAVMDSAAGGG